MTVLISYSHDSENHKKWVLYIASKLKLNGIRVILDQTHLNAGDYLTTFMEEHIENVDYVLLICTDNYNQRAKDRIGGVGYEINLISAEILASPRTNKFIPIVRNIKAEKKTPACVNGKLYCDFSDNQNLEEQFSNLVKRIKGADSVVKEAKSSLTSEEGWSTFINDEKILFKQGDPLTVKYDDGKIEQFLVINDDIMCLEQTFPNGTVAYIEVNKKGDIISYKYPYPISEYELVIDKNLITDSKSFQDKDGFIHNEVTLKWGKSCSWILDPNKKLHTYSIKNGCELDHINKRVIIN